MRSVTCHLLSAVDILEPCPGDDCPFWDESCLLAGLRPELPRNPALVQLLLALREKLDTGGRPIVPAARASTSGSEPPGSSAKLTAW